MKLQAKIAHVRAIMAAFADHTGLTNPRDRPRRYLWTDAHAVCNFLSLYRQTGEEAWKSLALRLIDEVHQVLGKHRDDDRRNGWISGLDDIEGERHPTAGGLRIGKEQNERAPGDAFDDRLEWHRDGQYFHYLTKWMHALCRAGSVTQNSEYWRWAAELARAAHTGFVRELESGSKRLVWKMSIDLSYPLVASSGLHDPLDGFVTYEEIARCTARADCPALQDDLKAGSIGTAAMIRGQRLVTDDPLGIGGLLFDACRLMQMVPLDTIESRELLARLLVDAKTSLDPDTMFQALSDPAGFRLAFRELGLSIGLHAVAEMLRLASHNVDIAGIVGDRSRQCLGDLAGNAPLGQAIEEFWCDPRNQRVGSWLDHEDINTVMLATSLLPTEFLSVG